MATADATGVGSGVGPTTVSATVTGGAGGIGLTRLGANGGAAASSTLTNAVTGSTLYGALTLNQTVTGGAGGFSNGGTAGAAGSATSTLTFDDLLNSNKSATVTRDQHGHGRDRRLGNQRHGRSRRRLGSLDDQCDRRLFDHGGIQGHGVEPAVRASRSAPAAGPPPARSLPRLTRSTPPRPRSVALGGASAGPALATTKATGSLGSFGDTASGTLLPGSMVQSVSASATGVVSGTSSGRAFAGTSGNAQAFVKNLQSVAMISGAPSAASTNAVLTANSAIKTAFGSSPPYALCHSRTRR